MAAYNTPADAEIIMRSCNPDFKYDYPWRLYPHAPVTGDGYHKVGNGPAICGAGTCLSGYALWGVDYGNNRAAMFDGQLIFTKMADAGDSGAIIIRDDDSTNP